MDESRQQTIGEQLSLEIIGAEKLRATILASGFSIGLVMSFTTFQLMSRHYAAGPTASFSRISLTVASAVAVMATYSWLARLYVSWHISRQRPLPRYFAIANSFVEVSSVTLILLLISRLSSGAFALSAPPVLIYVLAIMLSILRLDFRLSVFVALLASAQYVILAKLILPPISSSSAIGMFESPIAIYLRAGIITVSGFAAGAMSWDLRRRLVRTAEVIIDRDRTVAMFGQHVSPKVADRLLNEHAGMISETRRVCILFLDIRDFTRFAESRTPTEVVDYLNCLFGPLVDVIDRHGGIINKFLGDGFLAVFGAPIADARHCHSAVRAALDLVKEVESLCRTSRIPATRIGIGLHTGDVVTGSVGSQLRREYTVIGDAVNLASRIEQQTKSFGAQILASEEVIRELPEGEFPVEKLAPVQVKGRDAPVQIYKLA